MALTKSFKKLVQSRVASDPAFGDALLREGIDTLLSGDLDTGKSILRDYIKATVGFEKLGQATGAQSLRRAGISCKEKPVFSYMWSRRIESDPNYALICVFS